MYVWQAYQEGVCSPRAESAPERLTVCEAEEARAAAANHRKVPSVQKAQGEHQGVVRKALCNAFGAARERLWLSAESQVSSAGKYAPTGSHRLPRIAQ